MAQIKWTQLIITDPFTADILKGLLETSEIPVVLRSDAAQSVHPFTVGFLGDVEIFVPEESLADAQVLIEEIDLSEEPLIEDVDVEMD